MHTHKERGKEGVEPLVLNRESWQVSGPKRANKVSQRKRRKGGGFDEPPAVELLKEFLLLGS